METIEVMSSSRRNFLKKAAYAAPVVVALGSLSAPITAHASYVHVAQVSNTKSARIADVYQENDGTKWVKTYENSVSHQDETNIFKERTPFMDWLRSFFA